MTQFKNVESKTIRKQFKDINIGDTFMIEFDEDNKDTVYMKTNTIEWEGTGIDLGTGLSRCFNLTTPVIPIDIVIQTILEKY